MSKEIRHLPVAFEVRAAGEEEQKTITGSILYDTDSQVMRDFFGDEFKEILSPGCFDESLKNRDVVALWSHDTGQVLGNTKSKTLRVDSNEQRLAFELDLPNTQAGRDAFETIQRGDVDGVSFGMVVNGDHWKNEDGIFVRTILLADLYEISPVAFPAFPTNQVSCRSLEEFKEEQKMAKAKKITLEEKIEQVEKEVNGLDEEETKVEKETRTIPAVAITRGNKLEQREAFNHYLRTGETREVDPLMVSGDGGALAPQDFAKEIIDGLNEDVVMRKLARILPAINGKSAAYPRRTGGGGAAMVAEGGAITPHDLEFDQVVLTPHKAAAIVEVSNELLQDTGVDLAGYLAQHFRDEIGELLETQYWKGNGTAPNLQGILTADDGATVDPELLIERIETAGEKVAVADILGLWAKLPARYRKNATFVCNSALEAQLRGLKDGAGQYLMVRDLTGAMGDTLLGRPLVIAEEFPGDLTAGTDALMVGDFSKAVYIADKRGIDIQRNDTVGFYSDVTAFRAIMRTDIALALPEALKVLAIKS
jgi:HK97 family phage major capsid protein/HK97 family phage prohead protease